MKNLIFPLVALLVIAACSKKKDDPVIVSVSVQNYKLVDSSYNFYDSTGKELLSAVYGNNMTTLTVYIDQSAKKASYLTDTFSNANTDSFRRNGSTIIPDCISQTMAFFKDTLIITRKMDSKSGGYSATQVIRGYK